MRTFTYTVQDRNGMHARPAGAVIREVNKFKADVSLSVRGQAVSLKAGIFGLLGLGIRAGETVTVSCSGVDEAAAAAALRTVFTTNL